MRKLLLITLLASSVAFVNCSPQNTVNETEEASLQIEITKNTETQGVDQQRSFDCDLNWTPPVAGIGDTGDILEIFYPPAHVTLSEIDCLRQFYFTQYTNCDELLMATDQPPNLRRDRWLRKSLSCTGKSTLEVDVDSDPRTQCTGCCDDPADGC